MFCMMPNVLRLDDFAIQELCHNASCVLKEDDIRNVLTFLTGFSQMLELIAESNSLLVIVCQNEFL